MLLALLALDAQAVIHAPHKREISLDAFLANRPEYLVSHTVITEVYLPILPPGSGAALVEISRTPRDRPIVNAAAFVARRGRTCHMARLVLGGVAPYPIRLLDVEAMFFYQPFGAELLSRAAQAASGTMNPPDDHLASAEYRQAMAAVVAERALREAWEQTSKE